MDHPFTSGFASVRCKREIEKFKEVIYWAPFVLIGDDVSLDFKDIWKLKQINILCIPSIQYKVTLIHNYSLCMSTDTCVLFSFQLGYEFIFCSDKLRGSTIKWTRLPR